LIAVKQQLKRTPLYVLYKQLLRIRHEVGTAYFRSHDTSALYCIGCGKHWKSFKPIHKELINRLRVAGWPYALDDAETLNWRGYTCRGCGITDRDRLSILYLERTMQKSRHYDVVEFAPTPALRRYFDGHKNVTLRTADMFMEDVDDHLDIQDLSTYEDGQYDLVICSHVLEHVTDDLRAMKELHRILKSDGQGIVMVPIIESLAHTQEDPTITDSTTRMRLFGQDDHVRIYAKGDFVHRLESVGFKVNMLGSTYFGQAVLEKNAISSKSVLYVVGK
jgi:SAM-dependent methyltransferase